MLSDVVDRRDHVLVTPNGKPAVALVPIAEYEALEETAEILSDFATLAAIEAGVAELAKGETVTLADVRAELAQRRAAHRAVASVVLARRARQELLDLNWPLIDAVEDALGLLGRDSLVGHELRGRPGGLRLLRVGTYRIIYQLADGEQTVRIAAIRHRAVAYQSDPAERTAQPSAFAAPRVAALPLGWSCSGKAAFDNRATRNSHPCPRRRTGHAQRWSD